MDNFKLGKDKANEVVLHVISLATGMRISLWMECPVNKPIACNKNKMRENKYAPVADTRYPLWMVPSLYQVRLFEGDRVEPTKPKEFYQAYFDAKENSFDHELTVSQSNKNPKNIDIKIQEDGKDPVVHEDLSKEAADMYIQYYMGNDDVTSLDLERNDAYKVARKEKPPVVKKANAKPLDEYRGEFLKLAYVLLRNKELNDMYDVIEKKASEDSVLKKLGTLESLVDSAVGLEYVDNDNIGDTSHVEYAVEDTIDKLGQLLLIARMIFYIAVRYDGHNGNYRIFL